eukprot:5373153-Pyramimonas_sp.AAC.1
MSSKGGMPHGQHVDQGVRCVMDSGRIAVIMLGSMQFQDPQPMSKNLLELQKEYCAELEDAGGGQVQQKDEAAFRTPLSGF